MITLKFAQTLDGRIAASDGSSKWISGPGALKMAHRLRSEADAVVVGANTVIKDDPLLTVRRVKGKSPARIIIDPRLRVPLTARLFKDAGKIRTIIVTSPHSPSGKWKALEKSKVEILPARMLKRGNIDLKRVIRILNKKGLTNILVEGGAATIASFIKTGLADRIIAVISPRVLGSGINSVGYLGINNIKEAVTFRFGSVKKAGNDIIYTAFRNRRSHGRYAPKKSVYHI